MSSRRPPLRRLGLRTFAALIPALLLLSCAPPRPRTVVLVTLDTLKTHYIDLYNSEAGLTPFLKELGDGGTVFEHAYTQVPLTLPAHTAMFTGTSPFSNGIMANGDIVPEELVTLAERFSEAGYSTAAFPALGVLQPQFQLTQGFDHVALWRDDPFRRAFRRAPDVVDDALEWLSSLTDEPAFLWVHLSDPHEPYHPSVPEPDVAIRVGDTIVAELELASRKTYQVTLEVPAEGADVVIEPIRVARRDDWPRTRLMVHHLALAGDSDDVGLEGPELSHRMRGPLTVRVENTRSAAAEVTLEIAGELRLPPKSQARANYAEEVQLLDRELARLRSELRQAGRADPLWMIVTDHGEGLFRHGMLGHSDGTWEDQLKLGWLIRGPGVPQRRVIGARAQRRRRTDAPRHRAPRALSSQRRGNLSRRLLLGRLRRPSRVVGLRPRARRRPRTRDGPLSMAHEGALDRASQAACVRPGVGSRRSRSAEHGRGRPSRRSSPPPARARAEAARGPRTRRVRSRRRCACSRASATSEDPVPRALALGDPRPGS